MEVEADTLLNGKIFTPVSMLKESKEFLSEREVKNLVKT